MSAWRERVEIAGGRAVLYLGDNREIWPALGVRADAIVTDPPYGIGWAHRGGGRGLSSKRHTTPIIGDDVAFDPGPWLQRSDEIVLWGANHFAARLPHGRWLAWNKLADLAPFDSFSDVEFAWHNRRGADRIYSLLWKGLLQGEKINNGLREHPTQKPVALMGWCLDQAKVFAGAVVADPYMGAGSTGVACMRRGCRFIGIEIDEGYFRTACRRIGEAARQPDLLIPETAA